MNATIFPFRLQIFAIFSISLAHKHCASILFALPLSVDDAVVEQLSFQNEIEYANVVFIVRAKISCISAWYV